MKEVSFTELCSFLKVIKVNAIYLIHEPYREQEAREVATNLQKAGFVALVANDFRAKGRDAVKEAIGISDWVLVLAFDDETVEKCLNSNVAVYDLREGRLAGNPKP